MNILSYTDHVTHELKSPLRGIKFCADVVLEDDGENLSGESVTMLERIRENADHMVGFLDAVLAYARTDEDTVPFAPVDLGTVVQRALAALSPLIGSTGAVCEVATLPVVRGNPEALVRVFLNVLENALMFRDTSRPPAIAIYSVPPLPTDSDPAPRQVDIIVTDNGTGFDNAHAERIFEPLVRLVGRSEVRGSGLGLAMVQKIVTRHGGEVSARGVPGEGAQITIRLPLDPDAVTGSGARQ